MRSLKMNVVLTPKLLTLYEYVTSLPNVDTDIRSSKGFRIYCNDIDKKLFFYSVFEKHGGVSVRAVFIKNIVTIAPKIVSLIRDMASSLSMSFSQIKRYFLIGSNYENTTIDNECIINFMAASHDRIKNLVQIIGRYYAPVNYEDMMTKKGLRVRINANSQINYGSFVIGRNSIINGSIQSKCGKVFIGQFVAGGYNIEFIAGNHLTQLPNLQITLQKRIDGGTRKSYLDKGYIDIGNNVWIGDNTVFLKNVTVGDGAIIGSGAVVTHDVPPFAIVAGVPAKIIKYRYTKSVINQMMDIQWWNWPMEKILSEKKFFATEIPSDEDFDVYSLLN